MANVRSQGDEICCNISDVLDKKEMKSKLTIKKAMNNPAVDHFLVLSNLDEANLAITIGGGETSNFIVSIYEFIRSKRIDDSKKI